MVVKDAVEKVEMELITAQIARLELKPTDVLVVRMVGHGPLSNRVADIIRAQLRDALGTDRKVLVCDESMELSILEQTVAA
jgi:hypothetical protein